MADSTFKVRFREAVNNITEVGISFENLTTGATPTGFTRAGQGSDLYTYTVTWDDLDVPKAGDAVQWQYNGAGNYVTVSNNKPLGAQTLNLINCAPAILTAYKGDINGVPSTNQVTITLDRSIGGAALFMETSINQSIWSTTLLQSLMPDDGGQHTVFNATTGSHDPWPDDVWVRVTPPLGWVDENGEPVLAEAKIADQPVSSAPTMTGGTIV